MSKSRHLVAVWNPSYAADAMDEHLRILVEWSEKHQHGKVGRDEVFVWWARLRSVNRNAMLPHIDEVLGLCTQIEAGVETHLYLTDYRSLYVAHLADITNEPLLEQYPDDADHLPAYEHDRPADLYFQLWDIRRLVADDTIATVEELKNLRNVRYDLRPVSLYGGMTDLPLIVERPDPRLWFSDDGALTQGRLWAEHDVALRGETDRVSRDLRENLFGDRIWSLLEHGTRAFLATGEAMFRARRADPSFDFSAVAVEYAKALETELNAIVFAPLRKLYSKGNSTRRHTRVADAMLDLGGSVPHQTLGTVLHLLEHNDDVRAGLRSELSQTHAEFMLRDVVYQLRPVAEIRNPAAHSERLTRAQVSELRERVLGIGQDGLICRLARVKL